MILRRITNFIRMIFFLRVSILLFLLCRCVEAEPLGTSANVLRKQSSIHNKEIYNIAGSHMDYFFIFSFVRPWVTYGGMLYQIVEN